MILTENHKKLVIVNNEKIFNDKGEFYCDNLDIKSIPEGLKKDFDVLLISRKSKTKKSHNIILKNVVASSNIFFFLFNIFKTCMQKKNIYLIVSITPFTFFAYLILFVFKKRVFVYLRSDGHEEYKHILGFYGPYLYSFMFKIVCWKAKLIACRSHLLKGKLGKIVSPSQLSNKWFHSYMEPSLEKIELLYVGRVKIEKGIFSLIEIFKKLEINASLSIVAAGKIGTSKQMEDKNIKFFEFNNVNDSIIKFYDEHNIFVLPSYTEAHPQVLDEALSRLRPTIVFEDISHVIGKRKGVYVSKRDSVSLSNTISYIMKNYKTIQQELKKNDLPTKENFLDQMKKIINEK